MPDDTRMKALDGIRGIGILLVMLLHAVGDYFPGGAVGVDVFFVLSAFLITRIVMREAEQPRGFSYRRFYLRRALRLGPALLLWLMLIAAPTAMVLGEGDQIASSSIAALLYIGNYAVAFGWLDVGAAYTHIWSLAIEEQFYFVWPTLLIFLTRTRQLLRSLVTAFVLLAVIQVFAASSTGTAYFMPWGHAIPILGGCLIAAAAERGRLARVKCLGALPLALVAVLTIGITTLMIDRLSAPLAASAFALSGLSACVLLMHALTRSSPVTAVLSVSALRWLGTRSYGLYLYHRTLAILVPALIPLTLKTAAPLVLALSFVIAEISYRYVERPVMAAGHRRLHATRSGGTAGAAT